MLDENKAKGYALCVIQDPVQPISFCRYRARLGKFDNGISFQQGRMVILLFHLYLAIQEREADLCIATLAVLCILWMNKAASQVRNRGNVFAKKLNVLMPGCIPEDTTCAGYEWSVWDCMKDRTGTGRSVFFYCAR